MLLADNQQDLVIFVMLNAFSNTNFAEFHHNSLKLPAICTGNQQSCVGFQQNIAEILEFGLSIVVSFWCVVVMMADQRLIKCFSVKNPRWIPGVQGISMLWTANTRAINWMITDPGDRDNTLKNYAYSIYNHQRSSTISNKT